MEVSAVVCESGGGKDDVEACYSSRQPSGLFRSEPDRLRSKLAGRPDVVLPPYPVPVNV